MNRETPERVAAPKEQVTIVKPTGSANWASDAGVSVPESTVENPWLYVLSTRCTRKPSESNPANA
jgi:hypothetical protein